MTALKIPFLHSFYCSSRDHAGKLISKLHICHWPALRAGLWYVWHVWPLCCVYRKHVWQIDYKLVAAGSLPHLIFFPQRFFFPFILNTSIEQCGFSVALHASSSLRHLFVALASLYSSDILRLLTSHRSASSTKKLQLYYMLHEVH